MSFDPALPSRGLLQRQADWLAPARSRLLRQATIARRRLILDLGAGYGAVTAELKRRGGGPVVALDTSYAALADNPAQSVAGNGRSLPFAPAVFDLVFCQFALMWMAPLPVVLAEIWRVLQPGGNLLALEPDYGGLIEHPIELATRDLWLAALTRCEGDPLTGRRLPGLLAAQGFEARLGLLDELQAPSADRLAFLRDLPLTDGERARLAEIERRETENRLGRNRVAHLPVFLIAARKRKNWV